MRGCCVEMLAVAPLIGACFSPSYPSGLPCSASDSECPPGQSCDTNGFCSESTSCLASECDGGPGSDGSDTADAGNTDATSIPVSQFITIHNDSAEQSDKEVLIQFNSAAMIAAGRLASDCHDMRFSYLESAIAVPFWIESGCGTERAQVLLRLPVLASGDTVLRWDYGGLSGEDRLEWTGAIIVPRTTDCPVGSIRFAELDGYIPRGAAAYGATYNGMHSHSIAGNTGAATSGTAAGDANPGGQDRLDAQHDHSFSFESLASKVQVATIETVFCKYQESGILPARVKPEDLVWYLEVPSAWVHDGRFDGFFPLGAETFGGTTAASAHAHDYFGTTDAAGGYIPNVDDSCCELTGALPHTHDIGSIGTPLTTNTAEPMPPYLTLVLASPSAASPMEASAVIMTNDGSNLPPMGWERYTGLDSRFPLGSDTSGVVGGSAWHSHTFSFTTSGPSEEESFDAPGPNPHTVAVSGHQHSRGPMASGLGESYPPYREMVFLKRKADETTKSYAPAD